MYLFYATASKVIQLTYTLGNVLRRLLQFIALLFALSFLVFVYYTPLHVDSICRYFEWTVQNLIIIWNVLRANFQMNYIL